MKNLLLGFILRAIAISRFFLLRGVFIYPQSGENVIEIQYPSIIVSNHVSEFDVVVAAYLSRFTTNDSGYTVPAREDIFQSGFLVKEFKPKGGLKVIMQLLDKSRIIPFLLSFVRAIPVKRPFRDDARQLIKTGELRDQIDRNWEIITQGVLEGKNVFMFPEGTYTDDGYVNSLRRGMNLVRDKVQGLFFNTISLSYDYLSFDKPDVHVGIGNLNKMPLDLDKDELSRHVRDLIGNGIVVHHGNLFSFMCFTEEFEKGITEKELFNKIEKLIISLKDNKFLLSKRLLESSSLSIFKRLLKEALESKHLFIRDSKIYTSSEIKTKPNERANRFRKANPLLYHKNQLRFHEKKLFEFWNG